MESFIDVHSHILPGIDDGSQDFDTSIQMLKQASTDGIAQIILTPHNKPAGHNADSYIIDSLLAELKRRMEDEGIAIKLYRGNELYYRNGLAEEIMEGKAFTLAGSDYVLTEFSPMEDYDYIRYGAYSLMAEGYRPILAHVERYSKINGKADRVEDLIEMGCYVQVNSGSVMGAFGCRTKFFVRRLLKERLVHFMATDAHDTKERGSHIRECASFIAKKYGEDYARELLYKNPMHVIRNEYIGRC